LALGTTAIGEFLPD